MPNIHFVVNNVKMTEDKLKEVRQKINNLTKNRKTITTKTELSEEVMDLNSYSTLIEVVNKVELMTAICQMDGQITQCTVCDDLTSSNTIYYFGKWGNVPVVVVQTGQKVGSHFQYGSWFEAKKALYYMPIKRVFGVGVCGAVKDNKTGEPRVPLGYVVVSSNIIGYDHQKKNLMVMKIGHILAICKKRNYIVLFRNLHIKLIGMME